MVASIIKLLWEELTDSQKSTFVSQMKHAGWKDESRYPFHVYQIKDGKCYGWIEEYRSRHLKSIKNHQL